MPINIHSVRNHLEQEGWKLISDTYKNLDTELEMVCPQGHKQIQTYKKWRKYLICEQCMAGDPFKGKKNKVPIKTIDTQRILALDAATNITGYSIYDNGALVSYGIFKANSNKDSTERINEIKKWLVAMINTIEPDFIGIENIQLQNYSKGQAQVKTFQVLANLQGVLIDTIFEACIDHELVYPAEWRRYCGLGSGDTHRDVQKKAARDKVNVWYNINCTEDEADAICIGKYFVGKLKKSWGESFD